MTAIPRGPPAHQPAASRMSRCRTRAATRRRYSAVERTSSIGCELAGERLRGAVGGLRRRRAALEDGLGRAARIGVAATDPSASADVAPATRDGARGCRRATRGPSRPC